MAFAFQKDLIVWKHSSKDWQRVYWITAFQKDLIVWKLI